MIFIDRREPEQLAKEIKRLGVEVSYPVHLDYGDIMFEGNGEFGPANIAIERKKLSDLINSMRERRLAGHQARGLWEAYDYVYVVTEGRWRPGPGGEIEHWLPAGQGKSGWRPFYANTDRSAVSYRHLASFLHSMTLRSRSGRREPMRIIRTSTLPETAAQIVALYKNFTEKKWDEHHAHDQIYTPLPELSYGTDGKTLRTGGHLASLIGSLQPDVKPSITWAMAAQLSGVDRKAKLVAQHFTTPMDMVLAGLDPKLRKQVDKWFDENPDAAVKAWMQVKAEAVSGGKRKAGIGKEGAKRIVQELRYGAGR